MAIAQDIKDTQAAVLAALNVIAGQQAAQISAADAAAILANEQTNLTTAQGLIIPVP